MSTFENCQPKPVRCGCGGEAKVQRVRTLKSHLIVVMCTKCEIATNYYTNEAEAITAWNRAMNGNETGVRSPRIAEWLAQPLTK